MGDFPPPPPAPPMMGPNGPGPGPGPGPNRQPQPNMHNPQMGGMPMGNSQHMNMQLLQNPPMHFPTSYDGFYLRKADPEPGQRPSWSRVKRTPFSVSASDFAQENKSARTPRSVNLAYSNLRVDSQRDAIDSILEEARREEINPFAEWKLAYVKANRRDIPGTFKQASETTDIRIILKRAPRTSLTPSSNLTKYGSIIDTSDSQQEMWMQQQQQQHQRLQQQQMMMMNQGPGQFGQGHPPPHPMRGPPEILGPPPPHPNQHRGQGPDPMIQPIYDNGGGHGMGGPKKGGNAKGGPKPGKGNKSRDSSSDRGTPVRKESQVFKEKVTEWENSPESRRRDHYEGGDDANRTRSKEFETKLTHKVSQNAKSSPYHSPRHSFEIPPPPMGNRHYMSGGNRGLNTRSPPPVRKSSLKIRGGSPSSGKRLVERTTVETYAESDIDGEDYEIVSRGRGSPFWDTRSISDSTDPSSLSSWGSSRSRKYRADGAYRRRSSSRGLERRGSRRLSSRDHERRKSYREHRKPDAYSGLSSDEDSSRGSRDGPVHVHIHNGNPMPLVKQYGASSSPTRVPGLGRIAYRADPTYEPWLSTVMPTAPVPPAYEDPHELRQRQQEAAADAYISAERRRSSYAATQDQFAIDRARRERDRYEKQQRRDSERRLSELKADAERKSIQLEREAANLRREEADRRRRDRYSTYSESRYPGSDYGSGVLRGDRFRDY